MSFFERPEFAPGAGAPLRRGSGEKKGVGRLPAYELEAVETEGGPVAVALATDADLQRRVRLFGCSGPQASEFAARVEALARLDHPGLLPLHETARLPDCAALAVAAAVEGTRADPALLAEPARLALLAGALAHAAARGVELPGAALDRVITDGERVLWDFIPRAADLDRRRQPEQGGSASSRRLAVASRPEDAVQSFGRFLQQVLRRSGARSRYLRAIASAARAGRYPDARALADDLERLAAGEPLSVAIDGPLRRMRRVARRHPVALAVAGVLLAGALAGGLVLRAAEQRRTARLQGEADGALLAIAGATERAAPQLAAATAAQEQRNKAWDERERAYHATTELQPTEAEGKIERRLRAAGDARAAALLLARAELETIIAAGERLAKSADVARELPGAVERARAAAATAHGTLGILAAEEIEDAFRAAEFETGSKLSTETLGLLRDTGKLASLLDDPALPADRVAALRARLATRGRLVVSPLPNGVTATLHQITNGTPWKLVPGKPVTAGTHRLPAGNHLLVLKRARDKQTFRFPLLVRRGQTVQPDLRLPKSVPEGFVYCPPGPFYRGGPGLNPQRYRRDRIAKGFLIQQREVTIAEYREFLLAMKAKPGDERIPLLAAGTRYIPLLDGDALEISEQLRRFLKPDYPVCGLRHPDAAAYARWRGRRLPAEAEWEYAARGVAGRPFPWGNAFSTTLANVKGKASRYWTPAGAPATDRSILGVFGLGGNVGEWTATQNAEKLWILKGGSWGDSANSAKCAARHAGAPDNRLPDVGFRLAGAPSF